MPGANPVVSGTINILGFYYFYHPREAHHRFSPGLALKSFPAPRLMNKIDAMKSMPRTQNMISGPSQYLLQPSDKDKKNCCPLAPP